MFFTRFIELFRQSLIFRVKFYLWLAIPLLVFFHLLAVSTMLVMYGLSSEELKYLWSDSFSF
jgi:hypothetical protein